MKILIIAKKEIREIMDDRRYLIAFLLQCLVAVAVTSMAQVYSFVATPIVEETPSLPREFIPIGLVEEYKLNTLEEQLRKLKEIEIYLFSNREDALNSLKSKKVSSVIVVPASYEDDLKRGKTGEIIVYTDGTNFRSTIAYNIIQRVYQNILREEQEKRAELSNMDLEFLFSPIEIEMVTKLSQKKNLESKAYIVMLAGFLIPFVLFFPLFISASLISDTIAGEKERGTFELLLSAPLKPRDILIGKTISILSLMLFQSLIWLFLLEIQGVSIHHKILVLIVIMLTGLSLVGIGVIISGISKTNKEANLLLSFVFMVLFFVFFFPIPLESTWSKYALSMSPVATIVKIGTSEKIFYSEIFPNIFLLSLISFLVIYLGNRVFSKIY
ncbi:MAG: ABC transporter permease [Candidatus Hydrothermarchaeota archaeon]